jgi:hypothetical protein
MPDAKTPMQRQREERRALGWRDADIWLTPEAQQQVARLSEPGESLSTLIGRALNALDILERRKETKPETSDVHSEAAQQEDLQSVGLVRFLDTSLVRRFESKCSSPY